MSLVPNSRDFNASIEYSPVNNGHVHEEAGGLFGSSPLGHGTRTSPMSKSYSHSDNGSSFNSDSTNTRIDQFPMPPSGQKPVGYGGPPIAGWPTAPRKLSKFSIPLFIGDVVLILLPIAFLVLGIAAWTLNGKELSRAGSMVESAMNLGPTVYPLAFAAIGSRCLRSIAVHLAERGTTIATLEKLLGSQSLVSAIGTAFTLRSYSLLSLSVLLLWVLSPLGGQSSLRLLHQTNSTVSESRTVYYSDHDAPINPDETTSWLSIVPAVLSASLASSQEAKDLPVDLWAHPKIPRLDAVEQLARDSSVYDGDWILLNATDSYRYPSWTGVNVQHLERTGTTEFQIKYNYLYVDCERLFSGSNEQVWEKMLAADLAMYPAVPETEPDPYSSTDFFEMNNVVDGLTMFIKLAHPANSTVKFRNDTAHSGFETNHQPINFLYGASYLDDAFDPISLVHTCTPRFVTLDARVRCHGGECIATQLRYVPAPPISTLAVSCDSVYKIGCWSFGTTALYQLVHYLPQGLVSSFSGINPFDDWIAGSNITYRGPVNPRKDKVRFVGNVSDGVISERLTTIINTFYQATAWGPQITRAGLFEVPQIVFEDKEHDTISAFTPEQWVNTTEAVLSRVVPVYKANIGWVVSLLLTTVVLLILGILNVVVSFLTIAPDLFYYASSLARENPYADTPDGGTALDGSERSRLLRALRVQIADASPEHEVGYVVLKSVGDDEGFQTGRLKENRMYW